MPTSQGNHHPKPEAVKLGTSKKTYATAYAFRPPTNRYPNWTWRMRIHSEKKLQFSSIGRLKRRDVLKKMDLAYQESKPKDYVEHVEKSTFAEIIEMWYLDSVVPRLPTADIRDEFKLSKYTVQNYRNAKKHIENYTKGLLIEDLTDRTAQDIVESLQRKYAPRTVQLHVMTLRQILNWSWKKQKIPMQITVDNKRPKGSKGYVNNRHTPNDTDVGKLLSSMRMCSLKKMVYIGWKTGARTGEVCDLRWKDIYEDDSGYWIRLTGKTGTRRCPISKEVYDDIRGFWKDGERENDRLFASHYRSNSSTQLKASCEKRGITPFTMYGLRRLRVDTLQRQGIEPAVYEQIMGHSIRVAQEIYRTTNDADLQSTLPKEMVQVGSKTAKNDIVSTLIGKLGLSLEEALMKLMG
jgi:integrase